MLLSTEQEDIDSTNLNSNHITLQINDHSSSIFTEEGSEPADHKESVQEMGAGPSEEINKTVSSKFVCLNTRDNLIAAQIQYFGDRWK